MLRRNPGRFFAAVCTILFCLFLFASVPALAQTEPPKEQPQVLWQEVSNPAALEGLTADQTPSQYRTLALNGSLLAASLQQAPAEFSGGGQPEVIIKLPLPDGGFGRFSVVHSPVMAADLAARYPEIQTYTAQGVDNPSQTARLDWTPNGLNATIIGPQAIYSIAPYTQGNNVYHISFNRQDMPDVVEAEGADGQALAGLQPGQQGKMAPEMPIPYSLGSQLRLYRLAITTSGEYTVFHGGTVAGAMAAIVTEVNEANAFYEREMAMRFVLVSNNDSLIYTNPATDPWSIDDCNTTHFPATQTTIDTIIGSANYDHGQLFLHNYCGGVVSGRIGNPSNKARAQSGEAGGSTISLHVFTHEVAHGFSASHTWSRCNGGTGGQFSAANAYEPGSGTTIMAYFGICGVDNVGTEQLYQFHSHSLDQMMDYVTTDADGIAAGYTVPTDNTAPTVEAGSSGFTWPTNTPFVLAGSATDSEGDVLTYAWEERDLGSASGEAPNSGRYPFFRVFGASETGNVRTFPQLANVVNNTVSLGEFLAPMTTTVTMNFRLHVWDNHAGAGGAAYDNISVTFNNTAGPFLVTSPNAGTEVWPAGSSQTVTWNVANTNAAPVNCATVNIALSTDGGYTYPYSLASGTANDGTQGVTMPAGLQSPTTRIRVACASLPEHFFFDISNANFTVGAGLPACVPSLVVQSAADSGPCSLRDTITAAAAGSTITFHPAMSGLTIGLTSPITLTKNVTINGSGANITISGQNMTRIFGMNNSLTVNISNLRLTNGLGSGTNAAGGAIRIAVFDTVTLNNLTIVNNTASDGAGGVYNQQSTVIINNSTIASNVGGFAGGVYSAFGTTTINNSVISGNRSTFGNGHGGGVGTQNGTVNIYNSTITGNQGVRGGGVGNPFAGASTWDIRNSTIANNIATFNGDNVHIRGTLHLRNTILANPAGGHDDCFLDGGTIATNTNNLIETGPTSSCWTAGLVTGDPNLSSLNYNGGSTQTLALGSGSPAIDAGLPATCSGVGVSNLDQRGYTRPAACDIGSFEYDATYSAGGNNQPSISAATYNVNEYAAIGTAVGTPSSSDPDGGQTLTYRIASGNTSNAFQINASTGQITVRRWQPLYYPTNSQFQLLVELVDNGSPQLYDSAIITINVTDINLVPAADNATWTILSSTANGTFLDYVRADDPDPNDKLTFAITGGNTGAAFSINANNGDISVANNGSFATYPTFNLTVQATDNGAPAQNDTATITIQVSQCTAGLVTSIADSGACTLRQMIADAASGGTVRFSNSIAGQTIRLASELLIGKNLTIEGGTQNMIISGDTDNNGTGDVRVFSVNSFVTVNINNLTVERGRRTVNSAAEYGGGVRLSSGTLTLNNVTVRNSSAVFGGGLFQGSGTLIINNSTISNNSTAGGGGAGLYRQNGTTTINNSTFNNNTSSTAGGGIRYDNATGGGIVINNSTFASNTTGSVGGGIWVQVGRVLTMTNSTFSGNSASGTNAADIQNEGTLFLRNTILANKTVVGNSNCINTGTIAENISNIIEDATCNVGTTLTGYLSGDPNLGALGNNGGNSQTLALISPSIAINSGDNTFCAAAGVANLDQRTNLRNDGSCDRGSYEYNAPAGTAVWDGGGSSNNWSEAANWVGDTLPVAGSTVVFNSTSLKNATVDAGFAGTVAGVSINSGYTGIVTLARSLAVNGNLSIATGAALNLAGQTLTVEGTMTNSGRLSQTRPATSVGVTVNFLRITNAAVTSTKYWGIDITPTASSLGNVTVTIVGNQSRCTSDGNDDTLKRCYEITPTTGAATTLRLYFSEAERGGQSANRLRVYHNNGAAWVEESTGKTYSETDIICVNQNGQACWVQVQNVTSFSPFVLGSGGTPSTPGGPTAISFAGFTLVRPIDLVWLLVSLLTLATIVIVLLRRATSE